jgi:hypothetical protein
MRDGEKMVGTRYREKNHSEVMTISENRLHNKESGEDVLTCEICNSHYLACRATLVLQDIWTDSCLNETLYVCTLTRRK